MESDQDTRAGEIIAREFQAFAATRMSVRGTADPGQAEALAAVLRRPEFGPFRAELEWVLDPALELPFRAGEGRAIHLDPAVLADPVAAAVLLRHACEIKTLQALLPGARWDQTGRWAIAGLALHCAGRYRDGLLRVERERLDPAGLPDWLNPPVAPDDPEALLAALLAHGENLAVLQGDDPAAAATLRGDPAVRAALREILAEPLPAAAPTEWLLAQGGDNRLTVDPDSGLNKYGCSPKPRPWAVTFASSTGSSVSDPGFRAAEAVRRDLLLGAYRGGWTEAVAARAARLRRELMRVLRLDRVAGAEAVLTASGTDGELLALYFSLAGHGEPLVNLVVAPAEVGSGTVPASGGLHFDSRTPLGDRVRPGSPVAGLPEGRVTVVTVPVRDAQGEARAVADIDREVEALVREAVAGGARVLLHLLDSSKTGLGAPSVAQVRAIQAEFGERVAVLVDAAQLRVAREALAEYLRAGFMVLITGSKFFTGPPFSGALLVPMAIAHRVDRQPPLPRGFAAYATASDFPPRWRALGARLGAGHNVGLLLRWGAALWEMRAFFAVPPAHQRQVVESFLPRLRAEFAASPELELLACPVLRRPGNGAEPPWDGVRTIYSFLVLAREVKRPPRVLTLTEAQWVYQWLNSDLSGLAPESASPEECRLAALRCHIGQPVPLFHQEGETRAALRIAVGARLVSGVEFDPLLGASREDRLAREIDDALAALRKVGFIARHFGHFRQRLIIEGRRPAISGERF